MKLRHAVSPHKNINLSRCRPSKSSFRIVIHRCQTAAVPQRAIMAVSKNGCGIKVELLINSNALVEFEDRSRRGEDRATTRYIPAAAGQEFTIAVEILPGFRFEGDCVESFIRNDFGRCAGMAIRKDAEVEKWESKGPQDSERKGGTCKQQYDFSLFETGRLVKQSRKPRIKLIVVQCTRSTRRKAERSEKR